MDYRQVLGTEEGFLNDSCYGFGCLFGDDEDYRLVVIAEAVVRDRLKVGQADS